MKRKKITHNHEIVSLTSNNGDMLDILYCTEHTKKKLECFCNQCRGPVCTNCILQSHNGHSVKSLTQFYKEYTVLYNREIQMKIAAHTQSVFGFVKQIGKQTVGNLLTAEKRRTQGNGYIFGEYTGKNQPTSANEQTDICKTWRQTWNNSIVLESFKSLPLPSNFNLTDFQPHINEEFELGKQSVLQRDTFRPKVIMLCCI